MKLAVMQPYFFPYIGYFQLIQAVDTFIVYDNIQYTKEGWINRNRYLQNGKDVLFTIPLKNAPNCSSIIDREISNNFKKHKMLNQLKAAYQPAPFFEQTYPLIEEIINTKEDNLFRYLYFSLKRMCDYLSIKSRIIISSSIQIDHNLRNKNKVIALCKQTQATTYINPVGGQSLYSPAEFNSEGITLKFLKTKLFEYKQYNNTFVSSLSIIDVLMFNSLDTIYKYLTTQYDLI